MLFSQLFTRTTKDIPKDETSFNAQALIRAGFIDKLSAGVYTYLPLGLRVIKKIENIIREEMNAISGQEILMPALIPRGNLDKTGRWETLDVLFKIKGEDKKEYGLGATHEEVVTPMAKKYIFSYKDLPFAAYQIQEKFRNELRAKAGLLRGRDFLMKDMYSFHATEKDLIEFYEKAHGAYTKIFDRLGLGGDTYYTFASGGTFAKYSHEFQTVCDAGEDIIYICDKCKLAINKEIIKEQKECTECGSTSLKEEKAIEVGNIFELKTKYSNSFELKYSDEKGILQDVLMGCYGIGIGRIMGTIVEKFHDEAGIIWPEAVSPFKVHLISLNKNSEAEKIYNDLQKQGVEVLYDDRENMQAGNKFADADLIGCPIRLVVSEKTLEKDSAEYKERNSEKVELIKLNDLKNKI